MSCSSSSSFNTPTNMPTVSCYAHAQACMTCCLRRFALPSRARSGDSTMYFDVGAARSSSSTRSRCFSPSGIVFDAIVTAIVKGIRRRQDPLHSQSFSCHCRMLLARSSHGCIGSLQGVHNFWHVLAQCVQCSHSSRMPAVEALCMPACVVLGYTVANIDMCLSSMPEMSMDRIVVVTNPPKSP